MQSSTNNTTYEVFCEQQLTNQLNSWLVSKQIFVDHYVLEKCS